MQGQTSKVNPWLLPVLAAFLLAALLGLHKINDADLGFHLTAGTWILDHHAFPSYDTSTYTVPGHRYVDMEWLYQILLVLGFKLGGYSLLSLTHIALALMAFFILLRRLGDLDPIVSLFFGVAVLACEARFRVRPEVPTWVLLGATLFILEQRHTRKKDLLHWLPGLQWLWVNSEGLFFLGFASMVFYGISGRVHQGQWDKKLWRMFGISLAVSLLNPYFLEGLLFPFRFLGTLGSSDLYRGAVQEFQAPWTFTAAPGAAFPLYIRAYEVLSFVLFASMAATFRERKLHEWALALFFFALSWSALRNIPLFVLACLPIAAQAVRELPWERWHNLMDKRSLNLGGSLLVALFLLYTSLEVITGHHWVELRQTDRFGLGLDAAALPEGACRFLTGKHLQGRIINDLDSGDWLSWAWGGKTFIDGRLDVMGPDLFRTYLQSQAPGGVAALITQYQPDLFCFNPLIVPAWASDLPTLGWRLVYLDGVSVIYLRKGYQNAVPDLDWDKLLTDHGVPSYLNDHAREILDGSFPPYPAFPWSLVKHQDYPNDLLALGIASGFCGHWKESEAFFLAGVQWTQGRYWDFFYNLGLLYDFEGRNDLAVLCMGRALADLPKDPSVRRILDLPPVP